MPRYSLHDMDQHSDRSGLPIVTARNTISDIGLVQVISLLLLQHFLHISFGYASISCTLSIHGRARYLSPVEVLYLGTAAELLQPMLLPDVIITNLLLMQFKNKVAKKTLLG